MKCHKLPWKQRGTVLRNAISRRRQSPSKLQASKPPPMVLLQYFMMSSSRAPSTIGYVPHLNPLQPSLVSPGHRMKVVSQVKKVFGTK